MFSSMYNVPEMRTTKGTSSEMRQSSVISNQSQGSQNETQGLEFGFTITGSEGPQVRDYLKRAKLLAIFYMCPLRKATCFGSPCFYGFTYVPLERCALCISMD